MTVTLILDGGLGDSGKGRLAAHLARRHDFRHVVAGGTGVGAAHILRDGATTVTCSSVPVGFLNPLSRLYIGPGTLVDREQLAREIVELDGYDVRPRLLVDQRCGLVPPDAAQREAAAGLQDLGLLFERGATAARSDYLWRIGRRAGDLMGPPFDVGDVVHELNTVAAREPVLVVGAHGTGYSLFKGDFYPRTVSDDCSASATLNRTGLAWRHLTAVIGVINMVPITTLPDVPLPFELTPNEIAARGWTSRGEVSGQPRRTAAHPSLAQIRRFVLEEQPTQLALGRMDLLCPDSRGARTPGALGKTARAWIDSIESATQVAVGYVGVGPGLDNVVELDAAPIASGRSV